MPLVSVEFGKYVLQYKLAEGGMAEVFLAKQHGMAGFEKPVVIKRILPHLNEEPHFVEMFLNEARTVARLSHPSIVHIFDFGRIDEQYFIAMEFIHGEDLRMLTKQAEKSKKLPPLAIASRIIADTLGGLHYAHTRLGSDGRPLGLVHRDVSPQNVLVTFEGGVKLVDFGIAKATAQAGQQTQSGLLKGKYAYMSPEQTRGKALDARSDVFSAGILLWEMITWRRLFRREHDIATMVAVAEEAAPPLSSIRSDVPPELDRICARALARPVAERYQNAQQMQSDLEALIRNQGWEADSIKLQQYMRDLFVDKLRMQDEAIRAAGVGSIEDFLARVNEGTQIAWIDQGQGRDGKSGKFGKDRSGPMSSFPTPTPTPRPGGAIAPTPNWPASGGPSPSETSNTTLRGAVGQRARPVHPAPSTLRRALVVGVTATLVSGAALLVIFWPSLPVSRVWPVTALDALLSANRPHRVVTPEAVAKVRVVLDAPGVVTVDGVSRPSAQEVEIQVSARAEHKLRVKGEHAEHRLTIPALDPGAVHLVRLKMTL